MLQELEWVKSDPITRVMVLTDPRFEGDISLRVAVLEEVIPQQFVEKLTKAVRDLCRDALEKIEAPATEMIFHLKAWADLDRLAIKLREIAERILANCRRDALTPA
jgi:hypothetical protein